MLNWCPNLGRLVIPFKWKSLVIELIKSRQNIEKEFLENNWPFEVVFSISIIVKSSVHKEPLISKCRWQFRNSKIYLDSHIVTISVTCDFPKRNRPLNVLDIYGIGNCKIFYKACNAAISLYESKKNTFTCTLSPPTESRKMPPQILWDHNIFFIFKNCPVWHNIHQPVASAHIRRRLKHSW
jgi:hypothetical protein